MRDWPTAKSQMSIISCTSPSPSAIIFPVSSVTSFPRSCLNSRKALPRRRTVSPRTGPGVVRHFKKASCAREIALSYSSAEAVRTLASFWQSIGEILSIFAPPPRHSPSKTPALSSVKPSFSKTSCIRFWGAHVPPRAGEGVSPSRTLQWGRLFRRGRRNQHARRVRSPEQLPSSLSFLRATILPQNFHRFVYHFFRDVERGTKTNGMLARFQNQQTGIKQLPPNIIARFGVG